MGFSTLKLDMSKAYDRVNGLFIKKKFLLRLRFCRVWVNCVMDCICIGRFSILINGEPHASFQSSRGLQQGDPLSLNLFLLCVEGLSSSINKAYLRGHLMGIPISTFLCLLLIYSSLMTV